MKIMVEGDTIKVTNTTKKEGEDLFQFAYSYKKEKVERKAHRNKHMHKKICEVCGQECRGNVGIGIHMAKAHKPGLLVNQPEGFLS